MHSQPHEAPEAYDPYGEERRFPLMMRRIIGVITALAVTAGLLLAGGVGTAQAAATSSNAPVAKAYNKAKAESDKLGIDLVEVGTIKQGKKTLAHVYASTDMTDDENGFNATVRVYVVSSKRLAKQKPHTVKVTTQPDGGTKKTKTVKKVKSKLVSAKRTAEYLTPIKITVTVKGKKKNFTVNDGND